MQLRRVVREIFERVASPILIPLERRRIRREMEKFFMERSGELFRMLGGREGPFPNESVLRERALRSLEVVESKKEPFFIEMSGSAAHFRESRVYLSHEGESTRVSSYIRPGDLVLLGNGFHVLIRGDGKVRSLHVNFTGNDNTKPVIVVRGKRAYHVFGLEERED